MWLWARDSNVSVTEKTFKPSLLTPVTASSGNPCIAGKTNLHSVLYSHLLLCLFCGSLTCFFKLCWDIGRQWHSVLPLYVIDVFLNYFMVVVFAHTCCLLRGGAHTHRLPRFWSGGALWGERWLLLPRWPRLPPYPEPAHTGHLQLHAGCSQ